jgi:CO/xanthine dehydrogenase Mo-binding subunit
MRPDERLIAEEPRADYAEKVTGRAVYASDVTVPGMLEGKVLRSTMPHARIRSIDVSAAESMPGVVAVLTGADLERLPGAHASWGLTLRDRPVIAVEKVRYVGDPVAAVAAIDEFIAEEALEAIRVDYEPLPFVTTSAEALAPGAPLVHDAMVPLKDLYFKGEPAPVPGTNIFHRYQYACGDVDAAFKAAARVFEDTFSFPMVFHYAMEPHVSVASCKRDSLEIWSGGQTPAAIQRICSDLLGIPLANVRVHSPFVGGGFGGKASVKIDPLAAALSWKAKRPVRICLGISESMLTCRRLSAEITLKTAVDAAGALTAKSIRVVMNGGAYADTGPAIAVKSATRAIGPYRIPNLKLEALAVYTNTVPGAAFRSIGGPQGVWATESQMDIMAQALGRDPVEFRLSNMVEKGEPIRPDLRPLDVDLKAALRKAVSGMDELNNRAPAPRGNTARGVAVAASDPGIVPMGGAIVRLRADGSILVSANTVEIGQGNHGVLRALSAKNLNQSVHRVTVAEPDTNSAPHDWGTGASRSSVITGLAVESACRDIAAQVAETAAHVLGGNPGDYRLVEGGISGNGNELGIRELLRRFYGIDSGEFIGIGRVSPKSKNGGFGLAPLFWETAAGAYEIEVDTDTGAISVVRAVGAVDVGKVLNRKAAEGQDEGAVVQGIGHTLFEEYAYEDGQVINGTLFDYHVPAFDDAPREAVTLLIESGDGPGPDGARGMGEGAILPVAPAIANALSQGFGVRIKELPLTPERVWRALKDAKAGKKAPS